MHVPSLYRQHDTPPWLEHAPLPVALLSVPSLHTAPIRYRVGGVGVVAVRLSDKFNVVFPPSVTERVAVLYPLLLNETINDPD